jgi:hypothetical protein
VLPANDGRIDEDESSRHKDVLGVDLLAHFPANLIVLWAHSLFPGLFADVCPPVWIPFAAIAALVIASIRVR